MVGLIGTGILGVRVLAGCAAYAVAKAAPWRRKLEDRPLAAVITSQVLSIDRSCDAVRYGKEDEHE